MIKLHAFGNRASMLPEEDAVGIIQFAGSVIPHPTVTLCIYAELDNPAASTIDLEGIAACDPCGASVVPALKEMSLASDVALTTI